MFLDESAPENVLEVTARAITYYLDVSAECTRRIVSVDGAVKMLCNRLVAVDLESRTSKDLAEQCVKVCPGFYSCFSVDSLIISYRMIERKVYSCCLPHLGAGVDVYT